MNNSNPSTSEALRQMMRRDVVNKTSKPEPIKSVPTYATVEEPKRSVVPAPPTGGPTPIAEQAQTQAPKQGVYSQLYTSLFSNQKPESPEEIAKREKREKTRQTIANLSDSLAHVANVWGAIKGGTPAKLSSLSDANKRRYEYANRQRLENTDAWQRGMFKAQTQDMQNDKQDAIFKAQQEAAQRKHDFEVKKAQQENERKDLEFKFKVEEAERKHKLDEEKAKADKEYKQGLLEISKSNAESNRVRANAYSTKTTGTGANKMIQFAMSDGSVVEVPDKLKKDYYSDVHKVLTDVVTQAGDENAMKFLTEEIGMLTSRSQKQMEDVHSLAKRYPEVEAYMKQRAQEYMAGSNITTSSVNPDDIDDEIEDIDPVMQALENLIPNM